MSLPGFRRCAYYGFVHRECGFVKEPRLDKEQQATTTIVFCRCQLHLIPASRIRNSSASSENLRNWPSGVPNAASRYDVWRHFTIMPMFKILNKKCTCMRAIKRLFKV